MARLYDRIIAGDVRPAVNQDVLTTDGTSAFTSVPVIVADNVAEFYFAGTDQEVWDINKDFPNIAPPFESFWMEAARPSRIVSEEFGITGSDSIPRRWGAHFFAFRNPDTERDPRWEWTTNAIIWSTWHGVREVLGPLGVYGVCVNKRGEPVDVWRSSSGRSSPHFTGALLNKDGSPEFMGSTEDIFTEFLAALMKPLLLAISFMHCKNVARREVTQPAALSKKWNKKHGRPLVRYHVLDIDPMRKVLRDEGGSETTGLKKALHICRGHFATYTDDAPLFGRITGTFWKPQHVRGSASEGIVVKDYNVKAPPHV